MIDFSKNNVFENNFAWGLWQLITIFFRKGSLWKLPFYREKLPDLFPDLRFLWSKGFPTKKCICLKSCYWLSKIKNYLTSLIKRLIQNFYLKKKLLQK